MTYTSPVGNYTCGANVDDVGGETAWSTVVREAA